MPNTSLREASLSETLTRTPTTSLRDAVRERSVQVPNTSLREASLSETLTRTPTTSLRDAVRVRSVQVPNAQIRKQSQAMPKRRVLSQKELGIPQ
ncbi:MAG: hypothetical protein V7K14_22205 [Nostoc sp.]|uniref:hypothetical protein n=1 Tax=Nostoc sp. TaxID=1180 RepID=UPI002FFA1B64